MQGLSYELITCCRNNGPTIRDLRQTDSDRSAEKLVVQSDLAHPGRTLYWKAQSTNLIIEKGVLPQITKNVPFVEALLT